MSRVTPSAQAQDCIQIGWEPSPLDLVQKVALHCLTELTISLTLGTIVACFVITPVGLGFLATAIFVQSAVSIIFCSIGAFCSYKAAQGGSSQDFYQWALSSCEWITGANFAYCTGYNTQFLIHETGHTMAAFAVYKNPRPLIEIKPFCGGMTEFYKTSLSPFGKKIGPVAATCLVIASGPGFTLLVSAAILIIGFAIKEKYPHFAKYLIAWSLLDFGNHAHYAYTALYTAPSNLSHDFVHLKIFGLHPVVAMIGIIAIPVIITAGAYLLQSPKKELSIALI